MSFVDYINFPNEQHVSLLCEDDLKDGISCAFQYLLHLNFVNQDKDSLHATDRHTFQLHRVSPSAFTADQWQQKISEQK